MEIQCPKCHAWLHTKNALAFHAIQAERCFPSSFDSIADKVQSRIETLQVVEVMVISMSETQKQNQNSKKILKQLSLRLPKKTSCNILYHSGCSGLWGDCSGLWGDCSGIHASCDEIVRILGKQ